MAEAMVETQTLPRFFCYKCNVEFDHISQDYICPYCSGGFVEQLEGEMSITTPSTASDSESDMIAIEDPDDASLEDHGHGLTDLAFLMTNGRIRGVRGGINLGNTENLLQHILMAWSGDAGPTSPVVVVGTSPGDYVFGGESFDAVVTQLLGQLEGSGPPPLSADRIAAIPSVEITQEQVDSKLTCSVCWDAFNTGENVRKLECDHVYHGSCIEPWLKLHGTCPVCRRSLVPERPQSPPYPIVAESRSLFRGPGAAPGTETTPPGAPSTAQVRTGVFRTFIEPHRDIPPRITALLMRAAAHGVRPSRGPYRVTRPRPSASRNNGTQPQRSSNDSPQASEQSENTPSPTAGYSMDIDFD